MNYRLRSTMTCLVTLGALFPVLALRAEVPNRSVESLKKNASHIVVGKVTKISHDTTKDANYEDTKSTVEVSVTTVEKGEGVKVGDIVKVRYWNKSWIGKGNPPLESNGHRGVSKMGETTRIYLNHAKDRGYDVILPNGFESIKPEAK